MSFKIIIKANTNRFKNQDNQFSTAVSMFTVGGMIGSFSTTFMVTKFGRKGAQFVNCFASFIGGAFYVASFYLSSHYCLLLARLAVGFFAGLSTGICPMYVIEISTADFRGKAGVLPQLFITIGILTAQVSLFLLIILFIFDRFLHSQAFSEKLRFGAGSWR